MGSRRLTVLDTHAWVWYATEDSRLSKRAKAETRKADGLGVHPVSCWEVAILVEHRRLRLRMPVSEWINAALERPKIELLPFLASAAVRAAGLGAGFPGDPADRFIVATTLELGTALITSDQPIHKWGHVPVIW